MGRLAELYAKKHKGELSDEEEKELSSLVSKADGDTPDPATDTPDENIDEEVDKAAQKFANAFQTKLDERDAKFEKMLKGISDNQPQVSSVTDKSSGFIIDKELGKKSLSELSEIKVQMPSRKQAGKGVTELSMKTIKFVEAFFYNMRFPGAAVEKLQVLSEGTAADGGYLVPEEWANMIVEDVRDLNVMRQIAAPPINVTTDTFHLPSLASRPKANWAAEKAAKQTSTAQFTENVLTPYTLASIVPLTNQLVADASVGVGGSIVNYITQLLATALAEKEEEAFWIGNGSGKPTGVDGGGYTLRSVAAGLTDATRADAIIQALFATPQGYRNKGVWVANAGTWQEIARLKDGQGRYFLTNLADSATTVLRGRPIYEVNSLAGGTALFGDFNYYQIVDREGVSIRVSDEAVVGGVSGFEKNITFVRAEKRVDAELILPAAITKVTGLGTP